MSVDTKYKILFEKLKSLGFKDSEKIDQMIKQIDSFSNLIIDLYLEEKEQ